MSGGGEGPCTVESHVWVESSNVPGGGGAWARGDPVWCDPMYHG